MPVQKIKSGRIITVEAETYVGDRGTIFYDEFTPQLRLSDGVTPGGLPFSGGGGPAYVLVTATNARLGGIKIGANISVSSDGTISVAPPFSGNYNDLTNTPAPYVLPTATTSTAGGIKVGPGLSIDESGVVSAIATSTYVLPVATTSTLGGIKVGNNLTIDPDGTLNANTATGGISDSYKTIKVQGQDDLVAAGPDNLEIVAGSGILISTDSTATPYKTLTIAASISTNLDGGFPDSVYGGIDLIDGGFV